MCARPWRILTQLCEPVVCGMSTGRTTAVRPRQATVRVYVDAPIANGMMTACLFALTAASVFVYWEHIATLVALVVGIAGITHVSGVACLGRRGTDAFLQQAFKAWSTRAGIALSRWIAAHKCSAARRQRSLLASSGNHARVRRLVDGVGAGGPVSNAMEASQAVAVSSCPCSGLACLQVTRWREQTTQLAIHCALMSLFLPRFVTVGRARPGAMTLFELYVLAGEPW